MTAPRPHSQRSATCGMNDPARTSRISDGGTVLVSQPSCPSLSALQTAPTSQRPQVLVCQHHPCLMGFPGSSAGEDCLRCRRLQFDSWVGKIPWRRDRLPSPVFLGFPCGSAGKESACNAGNLGSIPGLGRSPGEGKGCPLQYSGLENSMDSIVHWVAESRTRLTFTFPALYLLPT